MTRTMKRAGAGPCPVRAAYRMTRLPRPHGALAMTRGR
jgi:hypothetical protein